MGIEYLESKILKNIGEMEKILSQAYNKYVSSVGGIINIEKEINDNENYVYFGSQLYLNTLAYLDFKGLDDYKNVFYQLFGKCSSNPKDINSFDYDEMEIPHSQYILNMHNFLSSFEFTETSYAKHKRLTGAPYLENLLENTNQLLHLLGVNPTKESEVYKNVKKIIDLIFPSAFKPPQAKYFSYKTYKPDILVPELYTVIEYKFADEELKLKNNLDEIKTDISSYINDSDYRYCYVVFFVTEDFWGSGKFKKTWESLQPKNNWKAFYVVHKPV